MNKWRFLFLRDLFSLLLISSRFLGNQSKEIWVKRRQKAGFLGPISSKITLTKKEERRKRKSEEEERRRSKRKSNCCTFSFYNSYFRVFGRENCSTQKVHLLVPFSKLRLEYCAKLAALIPNDRKCYISAIHCSKYCSLLIFTEFKALRV